MAVYFGSTKIAIGLNDTLSYTTRNQSRTVTPSTSSQTLIPDPGYTGMSQVVVNAIPNSYIVPSGTLSISANGTYPTSGKSEVSVNLPFYEVYQSIALGQIINSSNLGVSEYCETVSKIGRWEWGGRKFWGEFNFPNLSSIDIYGLGWAYTNVDTSPDNMYSYSATFNLLNSSLKSIGNGAFCLNKTITSIYAPYVTTLDGYVFSRANLSIANFPALISISSYAFAGCQTLQTPLSFPNLKTIGSYAFETCIGLSGSISFPQLISIGSGAFRYCWNIAAINFPNITSIPNYCFANCSKLTDINLSNVTFLGSGAFSNCLGLISVSLSQVTELSTSCFYSCNNLQNISFPNLNSLGQGVFQHCWALSSIYLTASYFGGYMFNNCSNLETVSLPNIKSIQTNFFYQCSKLKSVYLMNSTMTILTTTGAFVGTPISVSSYLGYYGSIYVPSSLLTQYKTASNWSSYSSRFVGV